MLDGVFETASCQTEKEAVTDTKAENGKSEKGEETLDRVMKLIGKGLLESAQELIVRQGITLERQRLTELVKECLKQADASRKAGDILKSRQYQRRVKAITMFKDAGRLSGTIIPTVVLPDGYCGKIMLASVQGDYISKHTCLRSGDDWHREILRSFEQEVRDYGFEQFYITSLGGAFVEFHPDARIVLSGYSEELGQCDKKDAKKLVHNAFPDRNIDWS